MTFTKYLFSFVAILVALVTDVVWQIKKPPAEVYRYRVNGTITGYKAPYIYLEKLGVQDVKLIDSVKNIGGKFDFSGTENEKSFYRVRTGLDFNTTLMFVLTEKSNTVTVTGDSVAVADFTYKVTGSKPTEQLRAFMKDAMAKYHAVGAANTKQLTPGISDAERTKLQSETQALAKANRDYMHAYTDTVKNPVITIFAALSFLDPEADILQLKKVKQRLKAQGDTTFSLAQQFVVFVNGYADAYEKNTVTLSADLNLGDELDDIALKDTSGNVVKLSSLRGKYVLVDFWASWCGPCRMENPNIVKTYNAYKDKGFTVFGVSLDTDRARWVKAIKQDNLAWPHVSELKGWQSSVCKQFSIFSIPSSFLIDPQGKIVAKNLRGEELQTTLASLLK